MSRADILSAITAAHKELPELRYIVFTGGEITLLKEDLLDAIRLTTSLGLGTRIVTNGHWGRSAASAGRFARSLADAGLCELNLSTGVEHQEWVPFASVARAAYHAVTEGLTTVLVVEGQDESPFDLNSVAENEDIRRIQEDPALSGRLLLMSSIWMPFHEGASGTQAGATAPSEGCDNIFDNFVVNPYGELMSCCGLTMEHIPAMKVGNIRCDSIAGVYRRQFDDLLKLWIWLDGTRHIFDRLRSRHDLKLLSPHPCSICAQLYRSEALRGPLSELLIDNEDSIVFRAAVKASMSRVDFP
jgi:hypothetical protein